jgi:hypothetical protein
MLCAPWGVGAFGEEVGRDLPMVNVKKTKEKLST